MKTTCFRKKVFNKLQRVKKLQYSESLYFLKPAYNCNLKNLINSQLSVI